MIHHAPGPGPGKDDVRGAADDVLRGGPGQDLMLGFGGDDTFHVDNGGDHMRCLVGDHTLDGGAAVDTVCDGALGVNEQRRR
jgi:Ca2+-binding RTX toxin-like protein